jgi:hypothetical protein
MLEWSPYNAYAIFEAMGRIFSHTNKKKFKYLNEGIITITRS